MRLLDLTLLTPEENLALDEALLDEAEYGGAPLETLRFWESPRPAVVVGRSSRIDLEVRRDSCEKSNVPILRRTSGGLAVVAGPGCLMYAVVLSYELRPELKTLDRAHRFVLNVIAESLRPFRPSVRCQGVSDLALLDSSEERRASNGASESNSACDRNLNAVPDAYKKFSGNSVRCKHSHFLYHGTLLYDFSLPTIERLLKSPPRAPEYRNGRSHDSFVANLGVDSASIRMALATAWDAEEASASWPQERTVRLVAEKYGLASWNDEGSLRANAKN